MKKIVGKNLKLFREASNYTQQEIADKLGIDRGAYANYEAGNREMPFNLMTLIGETYGINLTVLFEEDTANLEKDFICAFRKNKISDEDQKEINLFKIAVSNYLKVINLSKDEAEHLSD